MLVKLNKDGLFYCVTDVIMNLDMSVTEQEDKEADKDETIKPRPKRKVRTPKKKRSELADTVYLGKNNVEHWYSVKNRSKIITSPKFVGWLLELAETELRYLNGVVLS